VQSPNFSEFFEIIERMPSQQLLYFGIAAGIWLVGGNILVAFHYRRIGKSVWSGFKPFAFPFKNFNAAEWLILAALAAASLTFARMAFYAAKVAAGYS
jgi:hypothetical protein